jgi:hypothetical protein
MAVEGDQASASQRSHPAIRPLERSGAQDAEQLLFGLRPTGLENALDGLFQQSVMSEVGAGWQERVRVAELARSLSQLDA